MTCRVFGPPIRSANPEEAEGLAVCELCFTQASEEEIAAAEMTVPHAEEEQLLAQLQQDQPSLTGETIIAYCLADYPPPSPPQAAS